MNQQRYNPLAETGIGTLVATRPESVTDDEAMIISVLRLVTAIETRCETACGNDEFSITDADVETLTGLSEAFECLSVCYYRLDEDEKSRSCEDIHERLDVAIEHNDILSCKGKMEDALESHVRQEVTVGLTWDINNFLSDSHTELREHTVQPDE